MNRTIEITVDPNGQTKVETKGFTGGDCFGVWLAALVSTACALSLWKKGVDCSAGDGGGHVTCMPGVAPLSGSSR